MIQSFAQFTSKQLNDGAAKFQSVFQSFYRRCITNKYTILSSTSLNRFICNQINNLVKSEKKELSDVKFEKFEINKEKKFFIKWDKKQEMLSLFFPGEDVVGSGFWKKFFSSNTIKIPLNTKKREITQFESVWTVLDSNMVDEIRIQKILYKRFNQEKPKSVYFLEPWEQIHQNIYTQRRLINRLEETKFNDPFQKAHCMRDIAKNLAWMHTQKIAHGDISLKNILIEDRIDDEGLSRLVCYLTDFGSTKIWGAEQSRKLDNYVRWDPCKCFADINTSLMDWYGFVITNIIAWFPEMTSCLKWENFISTRQMVFENELKGNFISDISYWTGPKSFSDLTQMEQRAWHLFIAICRKSSQLYLHFKNTPGKISKEEVEKAMTKINALEIEKRCLQFADEMCEWAEKPS